MALASTRGLRSGTRVMPVPSMILLVTPDARDRAMKGSLKWR